MIIVSDDDYHCQWKQDDKDGGDDDVMVSCNDVWCDVVMMMMGIASENQMVRFAMVRMGGNFAT